MVYTIYIVVNTFWEVIYMSKSKQRRRKGLSNEKVLKSVFGENYVPQYSIEETSKKKTESKTKENSGVQITPTTSTRKKTTVMPTSFINEETFSAPPRNLMEKTLITSHLPIKKYSFDVQQDFSSQESVSVKKQKLPSNIHIPNGISLKKIEDLLHVVKQFPSCDELKLDFSKEWLVLKENGVYNVITFKGEKILSYTFEGKYINSK